MQPDGRANPNQTLATAVEQRRAWRRCSANCRPPIAKRSAIDRRPVRRPAAHALRPLLHARRSTHFEPRIAYHHPLLDAKFGIDPHDNSIVWTDDDLERLIDDYVAAAGLAREVGFQFVDVKACHGYLLHEFLSARVAPGPLRRRSGRPHAAAASRSSSASARRFPDLHVGVRLSVFDSLPYKTSRDDRPSRWTTSTCSRTSSASASIANDPAAIDLTEPIELIRRLHARGRGGGEPFVRQPVLQSAHSAARHLSAQRRLSAAGRSARRRRPADSMRPAQCKAAVPGYADGRHAATPTCKITCRTSPRRWSAHGWIDFGRPRPDGALLSRAAGRHTRRRHARTQESLPHVQRLHHGPAQRPCLGVLSA